MQRVRLLAILAVVIASSVISPPRASAVDAGDLDKSFSTDGKTTFDVFGDVADKVYDVAIAEDGTIIVAGSWQGFASGTDGQGFALAAFNPDGSLQKSFGSGGRALTVFANGPAAAKSVAIGDDGKIVAAGWRNDDDGNTDHDFAVARYEADGDLDDTFSSDGKTTTSFGGYDVAGGVAVQPDGRIVVAGFSYGCDGDGDFAVARFDVDGSLDSTFSPSDGKVCTGIGGHDEGHGVALQEDGAIVVVGRTKDCTFPSCTNYDFGIVRYNANGTLDTTFDDDGRIAPAFDGHDAAYDVAVRSNGDIVAVGASASESNFAIARVNTDGSLDSGFGGDGKVTTDLGPDSVARGVAIQDNGEIVVVGTRKSDPWRLVVVRYATDGDLSTSFSDDGRTTAGFSSGNDQGAGVAIQDDGRIVVAGTSNVIDFGVARYHAVADNTPPDTVIDSGPGTTTDRTPTYTFHSTEAGSTFQCSLDGGTFRTCTSPHTTTTLSLGGHAFSVRARDGVGNYDPTPATRVITVEEPPDTDPPETTIDTSPDATTDDRTATFEFSSDESPSTFECRRDGGNWQSCTSPKTYEGLSVGSHVFRVKATDDAGNVDPTPARWEWQITQ